MSHFIRPNTLARYGTYITCATILIISFFLSLIRYPDVIKAKAVLANSHALQPIIIRQDGKLACLLIPDSSIVKKGEIIGSLETTADWQEVLRLSRVTDSLYTTVSIGNYKAADYLMNNIFSHLGELQDEYQQLSQAYIIFKDCNTEDDHAAKKMTLHSPAIQARIIFREAIYKLKNSITEWKKNYLLTTSIAGMFTYASFIHVNQFLYAGNVIAYVAPGNGKYYLQTLIPQDNLGKIVPGQKVLLRFPAWRWQEYGIVIGKLTYISCVASEGGYLAKIDLPDGLKTDQGKILNPKEGLIAEAEIVINDFRLSERLYFDVVKQLQ